MNAIFDDITLKQLGITFNMYDIPAPEVKREGLNIPGCDGFLDTTDATRRAYDERTITLEAFDMRDLATRQKARRDLESAIHGRMSNLEISIEPGLIIRGRWNVSAVETGGMTDYIITGACEPFRKAGSVTLKVNAAGGVDLVLFSGDKVVRPTFQVNRISTVEANGTFYTLNPGASYIRDLWLQPGRNYVHIDTLPDGGTVTWADLDVTWAEFATKRVSDWRWGDGIPFERMKWEDLGITWAEFSERAPIEWQRPVDLDSEDYMAYIHYTKEVF